VQVDPIKPTLKAPGTKRLKLDSDELLLSFAFKFNLRRYNKENTKTAGNSLSPGKKKKRDSAKAKSKSEL